MTVKCVEWISSHGDFSAAGAHRHTTTVSVSARRNRIGMKQPRTIACCRRKEKRTFIQCYHEDSKSQCGAGTLAREIYPEANSRTMSSPCPQASGFKNVIDISLLQRRQQATGKACPERSRRECPRHTQHHRIMPSNAPPFGKSDSHPMCFD